MNTPLWILCPPPYSPLATRCFRKKKNKNHTRKALGYHACKAHVSVVFKDVISILMWNALQNEVPSNHRFSGIVRSINKIPNDITTLMHVHITISLLQALMGRDTSSRDELFQCFTLTASGFHFCPLIPSQEEQSTRILKEYYKRSEATNQNKGKVHCFSQHHCLHKITSPFSLRTILQSMASSQRLVPKAGPWRSS